MQTPTSLRPYCLLLLLSFSAAAHAWGPGGHRIIGGLAQSRLTPAAAAAVASILNGEDLATASTWADEMRSSPNQPKFWSGYAANWHYVNIPPEGDYETSAKNPRGDAYVAMQTFAAILLDQPVPDGPVREGLELYFGPLGRHPDGLKPFALKFLIHLTGDLHQPLHSGYAEDRGGNDVKVQWLGRSTNLHALWDSQLLNSLKRSDTRIVARLQNQLDHTPGSDIRTIENADPLQWIAEDRKILLRIYARQQEGAALDDLYAAEFVPTVEQQLFKGGLRTAAVLNSLFGGWPIAMTGRDNKPGLRPALEKF